MAKSVKHGLVKASLLGRLASSIPVSPHARKNSVLPSNVPVLSVSAGTLKPELPNYLTSMANALHCGCAKFAQNSHPNDLSGMVFGGDYLPNTANLPITPIPGFLEKRVLHNVIDVIQRGTFLL